MGYQMTFKRYEKKYIVSDAQKAAFLAEIADRIEPDKYGRSTVSNIYFDTPNYRLIRASIEKPVFKEKLRLRAYGTPEDDTNVFVELKKKYHSVVYKRRINLKYAVAYDYLINGVRPPKVKNKQVFSEIDYFINYYEGLRPAAAIFYDREAYYCSENKELRFTFDSNIRYRHENFDLRNGSEGTHILDEGLSIMEIKCLGSMPLWVTAALSKHKIFPASYSKYGRSYETGFPYMI